MMSSSHHSDILEDPEFQTILAKCLEALERGETLDQAAIARAHPEFAEPLQEFLSDHALLRQAAADIAQEQHEIEPTMASGPANREAFAVGESIQYIGEYRILGEIARGGMGVVFKAKQRQLKRIVALKMILAGRLANEAEVQRFRREAQAAANLKHPHIVPVYEVGEHNGHHYFTMDFIDGENLAAKIRTAPLPPPSAARMVASLAEAIDYAHQQGTLHRDLKPANVIVDAHDQPFITDFGLAKLAIADEESPLEEVTSTGQVLGTPSFMSPEQAAGKHQLIGPGTDIYALGGILYACLTGRAPFAADSPLDTLLQVLRNEPASPRMLNPNIPKDLETICLKCLAKEPHNRYGTAGLLAEDLRRFLDGKPVLARPVGPLVTTARWCRRNPLVATLLMLIALSLIGGAGVASYFAVEANRRALAEARAKELQADAARDAVAARDEAKAALEIAEENEDIATAERNYAVAAGRREAAARNAEAAQREKAEAALRETAWHLYRAQLFPIRTAWKDQEFGHLSRLLDASVPTDDRPDFRGWEWQFFQDEVKRRFTTLTPPESRYRYVQWSPSGEYLALRREDGVIDVRGGKDYEILHSIPGDTTGQMSWHPTEPLLAVTKMKRELEFWNAETGKLVETLIPPNTDNSTTKDRDVAWSKDGKRVALSSHRRIDIWSREGEHERSLTSFNSWITNLDWSADGKRIGLGGVGYVAAIDIEADKVLWKAFQSRVPVEDVEWDPAGERLAAAWHYPAYMVRVYDEKGVATNLPRTIHGPMDIAWDADGKTIVSANFDQGIYFWDVENRELKRELRLHTSAVVSFDWQLQRGLGASVESTGAVRIWSSDPVQVPAVEIQVPLVGGGAGYWVDWSPRGNLVACLTGKKAFICDVVKGEVVRELPTESSRGYTTMSWHPTKAWLATQDQDGHIIVWDADSGEKVFDEFAKSWDWAHSVAFSPNGKMIASGSGQKWRDGGVGGIDVWNLETGKMICSLDSNRGRGVLAWSPNSQFIAIAAYGDRTVNIWEVATQQQVATSGRLDAPLERISYSRDGRFVAVGSNSGQVYVIDASTGKRTVDLASHSGPIQSVRWSPDGKRILTCSNDQTLRIWDAATAEELVVLGPETPIGSCGAWSHDGTRIVTANSEGVVRVWGTESLVLPEDTQFLQEGILAQGTTSAADAPSPQSEPTDTDEPSPPASP